MNTFLSRTLIILSSIFIFISCGSDKKQFVVQGTISGADSLTLYLEKRGYSEITALDSVKLNKDGNYTFKEDALGYSEFYRLRIGDQSINFSIDSTESITINANKESFASQYTVEGSPYSLQIKEVILSHSKLANDIKALQDKQSNGEMTEIDYFQALNKVISEYKEKTRLFVLENNASTAAYYVLFQKIDNLMIFDIYDKKDLQLFQVVGTSWNTFRPESPRSAHLNDFTLKALASLKAEEQKGNSLQKLLEEQVVDNSDYFAITLPNVENKKISTTSLKGKVVLVNFTAYEAEYSVMYNVRLNKIYEKYKSGLEIYQISYDQQKHSWRNAAVNLPWITVWDQEGLNSSLLKKFNVSTLPSTYLLDKNGEIVKKLNMNETFETEIAKIF